MKKETKKPESIRRVIVRGVMKVLFMKKRILHGQENEARKKKRRFIHRRPGFLKAGAFHD